MTEFTPVARQRFDDYMRRLRLSLAGGGRAEAEDVEQSVREHIDVALSGTNEPVTADQLLAVLDRLGEPERWAAAEQPWWRQALLRLRTGPEEWRLAYVALGLFALSLLLLPIGIGMLLMVGAFLLSRAYVEMMAGKNEPLGPRRWLVYPSIAFFLALGVAALVAGPAAPLVAVGIEDGGYEAFARTFVRGPVDEVQFSAGMSAAIFGIWWMVGSLMLMVLLRPVRFVFAPLLDRLHRGHVAVLTAIGAATLGAGLLLLRPWLPFVY